jgi:hypothetical protein
LGYLCLEELQAKQALGQYFVRRYKVRTEVLTLEGEPLDLLAWLSQVQTEGERWVLLGEQARLPVRVVAFRFRRRVIIVRVSGCGSMRARRAGSRRGSVLRWRRGWWC